MSDDGIVNYLNPFSSLRKNFLAAPFLSDFGPGYPTRLHSDLPHDRGSERVR